MAGISDTKTALRAFRPAMTDSTQAHVAHTLGSSRMRQISDAWLEHQRLRWSRHDAYRYQRFDPRFQRGRLAFDRKAYNPDQPRVPAGSSEGGQWTSEGTGSVSQILSDATPDNEWKPGAQYAAANRPIRASFPGATPGQNARLAASELRADSALRRVREIDPNWEPRVASLTAPNSVEGAIGHAEARAQAAEVRLRELGQVSAERLIDTYGRVNATRDLLGHQTWPRPTSAIAVTTIDGEPVFGVHSRAPANIYSPVDRTLARSEARALAESGWLDPAPRNIGEMPYNSLYHAESTVLLRAAALRGGSLSGRWLEVSVNQRICESCLEVLPSLGLRLGNPTVTFIDRTEVIRTMRDRRWW